jgi:hypothetical protein
MLAVNLSSDRYRVRHATVFKTAIRGSLSDSCAPRIVMGLTVNLLMLPSNSASQTALLIQ